MLVRYVIVVVLVVVELVVGNNQSVDLAVKMVVVAESIRAGYEYCRNVF